VMTGGGGCPSRGGSSPSSDGGSASEPDWTDWPG
jgi:hypothetical protein